MKAPSTVPALRVHFVSPFIISGYPLEKVNQPETAKVYGAVIKENRHVQLRAFSFLAMTSTAGLLLTAGRWLPEKLPAVIKTILLRSLQGKDNDLSAVLQLQQSLLSCRDRRGWSIEERFRV